MYNNKNHMTAIRYLSSIEPENFMFLAQIFVELFLIKDTLPLMYPRITHSQYKETDDCFALTVHMCFLNILLLLLLLCWCFMALRHFSGHFGRGQLTNPHCSLSIYQYLVHILSPVTDNCPSWISLIASKYHIFESSSEASRPKVCEMGGNF